MATNVQKRSFDFTNTGYADGERSADKPGQYCLLNFGVSKTGGTGTISDNYPALSRNQNNTVLTTRNSAQSSPATSASMQIVSSMALPMPNDPRVAYGADWTIDGTSLTERAAGAIINGNNTDFSRYGIREGIIANLKNEATRFGYSTALRKSLKDAGVAYNPHKELFFGGPVFRSVPLDWAFSFKNKREADEFDRMIEVMAEHMHPELTNGATSGVWIIPDTCFVEFVNAKTRKFGACVLTSLDVRYANSGAGWKGFEDGNPAHVALSMTLLEISPLTKTDIRAGK